MIELLTPKLSHKTKRSKALPAQLQIFIALNYFATGAVLDDTATSHTVWTAILHPALFTV